MACVLRMIVIVALLCISRTPVLAAPVCEAGYQPRGDVCVSQKMSDYIACVEAIGGNKQEITNIVNSKNNANAGGKAKAAGNGLVVAANGSLELDKKTEQEILQIISTKFFPGGTSECQKPLSEIVTPSQKADYITEFNSNKSQIEQLRNVIASKDATVASLRNDIEEHAGQIAAQNLMLTQGQGTPTEREAALAAIGDARAADARAKALIEQYERSKSEWLAKIGQLEQRNNEIRSKLDRAAL